MKHKYIAFTDGTPNGVVDLRNPHRVQPRRATRLRGWVLEFESDDPNEADRTLADDMLRPVTLASDGQTMTTAAGLQWRRITD